MENLIGVTIDRYKIISELGQGGMAIVFRAVDTLLDRSVAIKIIMPEFSNKENLLKRFNQEAKTLAKLAHSNIVKVLDYGEYKGSPYLVMEYIPGGTLKSKMNKPVNYAEAAALLAPLARALNYAHQQKVVHRDVKPANILINDSGQPLLSDFGILKLVDTEESQGLTGTGKIVGTPAYMSPEQIRGKQVDNRTDIYSLGIIFFEMVTGKKPYIANTPIEMSLKHLNDPIPKAKQIVRDLPSNVEQILSKTMAKNPEDRYQSMGTLADELDKLSGKLSSTSTRASTTISDEFNKPEEKKPVRLNLLFIFVPILAILLLGAVFLFRPGALGLPVEDTTIKNTTVIAPPTETPKPTSTEAIVLPTLTLTTLPPTETAEYKLETATPIQPTAVNAIQTSNISRVVEINHLEKTSVIKLGWTQDGKWIVNAGSSIISFIDPKSMKVVKKITLQNELPISMAISPLNDKVFLLLKNSVKVFDIETLKLITEFSVTGGVFSIAASPDGKLIALGVLDNKVQLISPEDGRVIRTLRSNYGGWSVAFSPDSSIIAEGTSQGGLTWETASGTWLPLKSGQNNLIKSLVFSSDGKMLAGGSKGIIYIWDVASGGDITQIKGEFGTISSVDFSPDTTILVSGSDDSKVRLWNTATGDPLGVLSGNTSPIFSVYFSPDGKYIVSGANEGAIRMWGVP